MEAVWGQGTILCPICPLNKGGDIKKIGIKNLGEVRLQKKYLKKAPELLFGKWS
jgi:hypothetical protein